MEEKSLANRTTVDIESLLVKAVENSLPIESLERLLVMRKELRAERARELFSESMVTFQESCPQIPKRRKVMNKGGATVRYKYANMDDIVEVIRKPLGAAGLSYRFETTFETDAKGTHYEITTCIVTHESGHSERSAFKAPVIFSDQMNSIQSFGSSGTYGQRYSLKNALGISCDEDDDGEGAPTTYDVTETKNPRPPEEKPSAPIPNDKVLKVEAVKAKSGKGPHAIKLTDHGWVNTFSDTFFELANNAAKAQTGVLVEVAKDDYGLKLVNFEVQG